MNFLGNTNAHNTTHDTFFSINVDEPFVDTHFPSVPSCSSLATRRFQNGNLQSFCWQRNRAVHLDSCFLGDDFKFFTYLLQFGVVRTCQPYSCFPRHRLSVLIFLRPNRSMRVYLRQLAANKNLSKRTQATDITRMRMEGAKHQTTDQSHSYTLG